METFSALLAICTGNSPVPGEFPAQRPVTQSFDVSFDLCWINDWVNNRGAGDLRRHRGRHRYDVTVMEFRMYKSHGDTVNHKRLTTIMHNGNHMDVFDIQWINQLVTRRVVDGVDWHLTCWMILNTYIHTYVYKFPYYMTSRFWNGTG